MCERNVSHIEALVREQNEWRGGCVNLIAGFFRSVLVDKKFVGDEVKEFRGNYQEGL